MTKEELTKEIAKRINEIRKLYYSVYPEGDYLIIHFRKGAVSFNNSHWKDGKDENYPIDYHENESFIKMNEEYKDKWC